jgi:hypothetical protein
LIASDHEGHIFVAGIIRSGLLIWLLALIPGQLDLRRLLILIITRIGFGWSPYLVDSSGVHSLPPWSAGFPGIIHGVDKITDRIR